MESTTSCDRSTHCKGGEQSASSKEEGPRKEGRDQEARTQEEGRCDQEEEVAYTAAITVYGNARSMLRVIFY
jgi:hypothetical protein